MKPQIVINRDGKGWSYQVFAGTRLVAGGWCAGKRSDAQRIAEHEAKQRLGQK